MWGLFNNHTMIIDQNRDEADEQTTTMSTRLDQETIKRIDHALEGTIQVDISKLSPDDKLTLLIERYNRKCRELDQLTTSTNEVK
jgi:hypothetical protein